MSSTQPSLRDQFKKISQAIYQVLMRLKDAVAVKFVIHCAILSMQQNVYNIFVWAYYLLLLVFSVDAVC